MMKTITCLGVTCLALLSAGCGMLVVPSRVTLPAEPMRTVLVSDRDTGAAVPSAEVTFQMWKYVNWVQPMPFEAWGPYGQTNSSAWQPEIVDSWSAVALGDGLFRFEPKGKTGWAQVWYPLGLPLGGVLYRTYDGRVVVQAPGYAGVWIGNGAAQGAPHMTEDQEMPFSCEGNRFHVRIRRDGTAHNNSVEDIGANRAESSRSALSSERYERNR